MKGLEVFSNPTYRRRASLGLAAALVAVSFAAGGLLGWRPAASALMIAAAAVSAAQIGPRAWHALRVRYVGIELLVTIAMVGAVAIGEYWEAAAVGFLFVLGAELEARTLERTRGSLSALLASSPPTAIVIRAGRAVEVPASEVARGEEIMVRPAERVPADGMVLEGSSWVDESMITGEPMPAAKGPGARIYAGTVNGEGMIRATVTGAGRDTIVSRIIRRVEEAEEERAPAQRFIERFARWYTPAIVLLAAGAYLLTRNLNLSLTLLVVACPGALVISTPVSIVAGIGRASAEGILIKGGEHLEQAARITAIAFDKTGTLTEGRPSVSDIIPAPGAAASSDDVIRWAAVAESAVDHPIARAILSAAARLSPSAAGKLSPSAAARLSPSAAGKLSPSAAARLSPANAAGRDHLPDEAAVVAGKGTVARKGGHTILLGTPLFLAEQGAPLPSELGGSLEELRGRGASGTALALDGEPLGLIGVSDKVRPEAPAVVAALRRDGIERLVMLTGDGAAAAAAVGAQTGIREIHDSLLPDEKLQWVRELIEEGERVAMVGDGTNDAPALAAATVGIAMGAAASDAAIETADIAVMTDDLAKLPEAIRIARITIRNIRQNLAVALLTVGALLAAVFAGEMHMAGAMLVHQASVILVILNAVRIARPKRRRGKVENGAG